MSKDLFAVVSGGLVGGIFWLLTQIAGANTIAIPTSSYLYALLGGIIAAGLAIYVPSDVDYSKVKKVFFVSAAAGLSFPSVISTATTAEDVAQIRGTNKQIEKSVEAVQEQISATKIDPTEVAQTIKEAGVKLNSNPASPTVQMSYDSVSKSALNSLSARASQSNDPNSFIQAIEQIGTVNPELRSDSTAQLVELSNSSNPRVSAAAKPALERQLGRYPFDVQAATALATSGQEAPSR